MSLIPYLQDLPVRMFRGCVEDPHNRNSLCESFPGIYWDIQNLIRMLQDPGPLLPPVPTPPATPERVFGGAAPTWSDPPVNLNSELVAGLLDMVMGHPNPQPNRPLPGTLGAVERVMNPAVRLESVRRMTERLEHTLEWLRRDAERLEALNRQGAAG